MSPLARRFLDFAQRECHGSSPLYETLARVVAEDAELLALAAHAPPSQPAPNLLLAAVHALLLRGAGHPLREFYASVVESPDEPAEAVEPFLEFCRLHAGAIRTILATRLVQTNEPRRSIYLAAAFARIGRELSGRPVALIELGSSAGLNLLWDRYAYRLGDLPPFGDPDAPFVITAERRGPGRPSVGDPLPKVVDRVGIDLNPIRADDPEGLMWLVALTWPEHVERRERLQRVIWMLKRHPVRCVAGDGVALLPSLVESIPENVIPCVYHTHVANQLSPESRSALLGTVERIGASRDVAHLHNDIEPHLHATIYREGYRLDLPLAHVDGHARWVEWLDGESPA